MPLPQKLCELVRTASFWSDYFGDEVFGENIDGLPPETHVDFSLGRNYSIRVGYYWRSSKGQAFVQATTLDLRRNGTNLIMRLGSRQDDGHSHPHALRWEELDLIGQLLALTDADLPHPGIPFLLLTPYVVPINGTDCELGVRLLNSAFQSLGVFSEKQIAYRISQFRGRANCEWQQIEPDGWVCRAMANYHERRWDDLFLSSLRCRPGGVPDLPPFPFHQWNK